MRALPHAGAAALTSAVFLGVAPSAIGFVLWAYALARMDVGRATTALYLVPAGVILASTHRRPLRSTAGEWWRGVRA